MKRKNKRKFVKVDADLDNELERYDLESSDDGLDAEDRILLENARGRKRHEEEEEVLPVHEASSSESDEYFDDDGEDVGASEDNIDNESVGKSAENGVSEEEESSDMDSDLEDKSDGLPDSKAWGSRRKNYYNTDYVDKDYSGFDDEEAAILEEEEAKVIQQRLLGQLKETDFTMGLLDQVEEKKKDALLKNVKLEIDKKIEIDRSKLTEAELKEYDEKETPGFNQMMSDLDNYVNYDRKIISPLLKFAQTSEMKDCPALRLLEKKHNIILRYSLFFLLFLRLKAHRTTNLDKHPIVDRLLQFSKVLKDIDAVENRGLGKQIQKIVIILKRKKQGRTSKILKVVENTVKQTEVTGKNRKERRKKMLQLLEEHNKVETKLSKVKFSNDVEVLPLEDYAKKMEEQNEDLSEEVDEDIEQLEGEKRAVTYQMLKNKGLTPKRKKEMRNPRVRNKNKFKKALVRRKGQVKVSRKEIKKYDGEISGIKKNLSRSVKLK